MSHTAAEAAAKPRAATAGQTMGTLLRFFVPLGFAACLVTITHSIIHATLAQAARPEIAIATYALGMSLIGLTERPSTLLRQTSSALVRDRLSFRAMSGVTVLFIAAVIALGIVICYTPFGAWLFREAYGADAALVPEIIRGYQFLMWVSVFSAVRCLYHGVIISQMRTKWVTIGMVVRLIGMVALAWYFVRTDSVTSGAIGGLIFAVGMLIEAVVCWAEGRTLTRKLPERLDGHDIATKRHVFGFYRPLLVSSFLVVAVPPAINALLGKTVDVELSIASFAVASSVFNLVMSVFTYIHQIVLNFYPSSPKLVVRFQWLVGFAPAALTVAIAFSPAGPFLLSEAMGLSGRLLEATVGALQAFGLLGLLMPWVDFGNGFLMLYRRTHVFLWSQAANAVAAVGLLIPLVLFAPHWNGAIGPLALAAGSAAELAVVGAALYRARYELGFRDRPKPGRGTA